MCGCEHHHDLNAPCTCTCPSHEGVRREMAFVRHLGYASGAAALRDAADDLEGRLGTKGAPRNLHEFRRWLRARADVLDSTNRPAGEGS